jgi:mono/diheme cytochrome c family protein
MKPHRLHFLTLACAGFVLTLWASAAERQWKLPPEIAKFKPGPGEALATGQCLLCHSADYISTQPPFDRAGWTASVQKMREKYGAPIPTNQIDALVDYLVKTYGKERSK